MPRLALPGVACISRRFRDRGCGLGWRAGGLYRRLGRNPDGRDFTLAMTRTWDAIKETGKSQPYTARFCATLVLAWPDGHDEVFEGSVSGQIVWPMRGDQGHGYDPIFQPDGYQITFGEMDRWEKNMKSHRAAAMRKFVKALGL